MSDSGTGAASTPATGAGPWEAGPTHALASLGNQFDDDPLLQSWLARVLPGPLLTAGLRDELREIGALAGGDLFRLQLADRRSEPVPTQRDAAGWRADEVTTSPLWEEARRIACRFGLVATGYDEALGRHARIVQFLKVYLFHASSDAFTGPLAESDGAVRCLLGSANPELRARAIPRLLSRDPATAWTSDQWLPGTAGSPDGGRAGIRAVRDAEGTWRLYGHGSFTSAVTSQIALLLARPDGNPSGDDGLTVFCVEVRDAVERPKHFRAGRIEDEFGTRRVPTVELMLEGTRAELVGEPDHGRRAIEPMLAVTRLWSSVCAVASMRRALALARCDARAGQGSGRSPEQVTLHADTLAALEAETWGAFLLTFLAVDLAGREAAGESHGPERALLRLLTPLTRLVTARQAVSVVTEVFESHGGAGCLRDTGLPQLLREVHMLPIRGGTTNALALDALLRTDLHAGLAALMGRASAGLRGARAPRLVAAAQQAVGAVERAALLLESGSDPAVLQAGARRFALTLARALELALLCEHAQWMLDHGGDRRGYAAALRFAQQPVDIVTEVDPAADRLLLG